MLNNRTIVFAPAIGFTGRDRRAVLARPPRRRCRRAPAPTAPDRRPDGRAPPARNPRNHPPTPSLIDLAIKKIAKLEWVAAELVQDINMLNQKYSIKGSYRKGPSSRVYLRLTVAGLSDSEATTLQVCDGETLWDYQVILRVPVYRKLSIKPILERLDSPELNPKMQRAGDRADGPCRAGNPARRATQEPQVRPEGRRRARRQESVETAWYMADPPGPGRSRRRAP